MGSYIEVVTELALDNTLTYSVPDGQSARIGARVVVTVTGKRHFGVVVSIHDVKPAFRTLSVSQIIDTDRVYVNEIDIELWQWISQYYMCSLGAVYRAAMPISIRTNTFEYSTQKQVVLATEQDLNEVIESLNRSPKQQKTLLTYLDIAQDSGGVSVTELVESSSAQSLRELCKKDILRITQIHVELPPLLSHGSQPGELCRQILDKFDSKEIVLLHQKQPIDSFELYTQLIELNSQTLILMPDSLAAEGLYERLKEHFKGGVVAYYPTRSDSLRSMAYAQASTEARVVVGVRGAVLLPMHALTLVIVDNEQDYNYKNSDSSPRINARDVALVKATRTGANVLLCSQAPTVESYYNATRGVWGLITVERTESAEVSFKVLERGRELLSIYLRNRIYETLQQGKQTLIFQNRRGFSLWVECENCFEIPTCHHCNVSLTYHKIDNTLRCHYCGYFQPYTGHCPECGSAMMGFQGRGTERIEESLSQLFPSAKISRIDYDSTRGKGALDQIAASIATDCDIIVGTQMVVRGVDLSRVSLIGIVNADNMLSQSDFRTAERAYSLLTLLSNRVPGGQMVIQTTKRLDSVIRSVESGDAQAFYERQLDERRQMNYPPWVRMVNFTLLHRDRDQLLSAATGFESLLRPTFGDRISPPFEPTVDRKADHHILEMYLRIERERSVVLAKQIVQTAIASIRQGYPSLTISADVDPM